MKYRHSFHAGNFADVHKHVALLALLQCMQRKDKGFLYLDTHAGAGAYRLPTGATRTGREADRGVVALSAASVHAPELQAYRQAVAAWQADCGDPRGYPGSPLLAARALRGLDRGVCRELVPSECRALARTLGGFRRMVVEGGDGLELLPSRLPAVERRALVLIDPPYESGAEWTQIRAALQCILERQANAVVLLWYPIKDEPAGPRFERELGVELLGLELWVYPRDARVGLNGSGLLIVNAPYHFAERASKWQPELWSVLDGAARGGQRIELLPAQRRRASGAQRVGV